MKEKKSIFRDQKEKKTEKSQSTNSGTNKTNELVPKSTDEHLITEDVVLI